MKKSVLVTCVGSGVGLSVVDSLNMVNRYRIIGCDNNPDIFARQYCHDFIITPSIYSDGYVSFLLQTCIENQVDIVVPGHDHELLLLSNNSDIFKEKGIEVLVSGPAMIEISRNKHSWYNYFHGEGCPVVPTFLVKDFKENPDSSILPAIVKPPAGSASQGILIVNALSDLEFANPNDIIQPYLFPVKTDPNYDKIKNSVARGQLIQLSEISIQLVFSRNAELEGVFISKNQLKSGVPTLIEPIFPEEFEYMGDIEKFIRVLKDNKVKGPVNLQARLTEKGLFFFEMNMRFTGITGNRAKLGFNEVVFLVNNFVGISGSLIGYAKRKLGARQVACTTIPKINDVDKKNYVVLGAGGSLGSFCVRELIRSGNYNKIFLVCRAASIDKYRAEFSYENVNVISESDELLESYYSQSDVVLNFVGALANKPDLEKYEAILFQFDQVKKIIISNVHTIINISSQSVYDQKEDSIKNEQARVVIDNAYAFQKYITERFFSEIKAFSPSVNVVSLRISRIVGVDSNSKPIPGFFTKVIETALKGDVMEIPYPDNKTNLIDIRDISDMIQTILDSKGPIPQIMNAGGTNVSLGDYCTAVASALAADKEKVFKIAASEEVTTSSMICNDTIAEWGWKPKYSLEDTIRHIKENIKM